MAEALFSAQVSNSEVADQLDMHMSSISRMRAGKQEPSFATMYKVDRLLGWSVEDQVRSILLVKWHFEFESKLRERAAPPEESTQEVGA